MTKIKLSKKVRTQVRKAKPISLTTAELKALCERAEVLGFANGPNEQFWKDVDPNGFHVVAQWFRHRPRLEMWKGVNHPFNFEHNGGVNIRSLVFCKMKGRVEPTILCCDFDEPQFLTHLKAA